MTEFAKNAQKPCQAFFSKKHPKIEQISDDFKSNLLYAALPKGHDIYDPTLNRAYEELSRFYHFIADPAKVRQPQHKGKVERTVKIVR